MISHVSCIVEELDDVDVCMLLAALAARNEHSTSLDEAHSISYYINDLCSSFHPFGFDIPKSQHFSMLRCPSRLPRPRDCLEASKLVLKQVSVDWSYGYGAVLQLQ
jgi:hypothetical protein